MIQKETASTESPAERACANFMLRALEEHFKETRQPAKAAVIRSLIDGDDAPTDGEPI